MEPHCPGEDYLSDFFLTGEFRGVRNGAALFFNYRCKYLLLITSTSTSKDTYVIYGIDR